MLQYCFCFMFWFSGLEACGILAPWPGIEPIPHLPYTCTHRRRQRLSPWITRGVPEKVILTTNCICILVGPMGETLISVNLRIESRSRWTCGGSTDSSLESKPELQTLPQAHFSALWVHLPPFTSLQITSFHLIDNSIYGIFPVPLSGVISRFCMNPDWYRALQSQSFYFLFYICSSPLFMGICFLYSQRYIILQSLVSHLFFFVSVSMV